MATKVEKSSLPYTELKPLPIPKQRCPNLKTGIARIAAFMAATGFGVMTGGILGLATGSFTVLTGLVVGGVVAAVASLFLIQMVKIPTTLASYRVETITEVGKTLSNPRVLSAVKSLKEFFLSPLKEFGQTYQNHLLHNEITVITEAVDRNRPDVIKVWKAFLTHLHQKPIINADGRTIKLDFSMELKLLETGKKPEPTCERLEPRNPAHLADFEEIERIQEESFGVIGTFKKEALMAILMRDRENRCYVSRIEGKVVAFAWMRKDVDGMHISGIARRPQAARLGIGDQLMNALLSELRGHNPPVTLFVRQSNPAKALYERCGFKVTKTVPNYFDRGPRESALRMDLDWAKLTERAAS